MVAHCVWLPAPRGGCCACGPAKPVPRPCLERCAAMVAHCVWLSAPPRGPLRLRPSEAGFAAVAGLERTSTVVVECTVARPLQFF